MRVDLQADIRVRAEVVMGVDLQADMRAWVEVVMGVDLQADTGVRVVAVLVADPQTGTRAWAKSLMEKEVEILPEEENQVPWPRDPEIQEHSTTAVGPHLHSTDSQDGGTDVVFLL